MRILRILSCGLFFSSKFLRSTTGLLHPDLILKNSDLFVMTPTRVGESVEGFGMAYIDASFHGVASVGSDSGGISDAIIHNETGIICDSGNQEMITKNILWLLENKNLRDEMGNNGRIRAKENYAWEKKIQEYLSASSDRF